MKTNLNYGFVAESHSPHQYMVVDIIAFYNSTRSHLSHHRQRKLSHMEMISPTKRSTVGRIETYSFDRTAANRTLEENQQLPEYGPN